jgi:hypothetical protein
MENLDIPGQMWQELKRFISPVDRSEAADILVDIMINHDHDVDQIRQAFKGDSDIKTALSEYTDSFSDDHSDVDSDGDEELDDFGHSWD